MLTFSYVQNVSGKNVVPLAQTTRLCYIQSVYVTDSLCMSLTVCV